MFVLAQSDWVESGITMYTESFDTNIPPLHEFHKHFDVVFVDSTGYFNICYAMNRTIFSRVIFYKSFDISDFQPYFFSLIKWNIFQFILTCQLMSLKLI